MHKLNLWQLFCILLWLSLFQTCVSLNDVSNVCSSSLNSKQFMDG